MTVRFTLAARKALRRLPNSVRAEIERALAHSDQPSEGLGTAQDEGGRRLRVGAYRVIVRDVGGVFEVVRTGHRKEIYQ